jgi:hypothetical protein
MRNEDEEMRDDEEDEEGSFSRFLRFQVETQKNRKIN